jgi:hypothetical protein
MARIVSETTAPTTPVGCAGSDTVSSGINVLERTADNSPDVRSTFRIVVGTACGARLIGRAGPGVTRPISRAGSGATCGDDRRW